MPANPIVDELNSAGLTVHQQVDALFAGTQALLQAAIPIRNVIQSLKSNHSSIEEALAGTYYRMCLMMESLVRLNDPKHFQVALQITRCLYESYIDVVDLLRDPALLSKFEAYIFVARFAAAEKLVNELTAQGIVDPTTHKHERAYIADPAKRAKFDAERSKYWPDGKGNPRTPPNWMDQNLADRAKTIGTDEMLRYRELYSYLCWFSHSGLVGVSYISAEGIESCMGMAQAHSQEFFFEATNLIAKQFDIYRAAPPLKAAVDQYKEATAKVMLAHLRTLQSTIQ